MSIPDMYRKIKPYLGIDQTTAIYLLVVVGVGISAFGLGRLSVEETSNGLEQGILVNDIINKASGSSGGRPRTLLGQSTSYQPATASNYVASKNGKLYYTPGCSGAKRIKPANEVWFETREEAEKLGYTLSTSCQ